MSFKLWDFVQETTVTTGTSDFDLAGEVTNYVPFSTYMSNGDTTLYSTKLGSQWETGIGTYVSASNRIERTAVLSSSEGGTTKVTFAAGTKTIICGPISQMMATLNANTFTGAQTVPASGLKINGATSGALTLVAPAVASTYTATFPAETMNIGYLEVPQNSQSAAYTTVLSDSGKHLLHPSADTTARVFTIDSNANVAYPVGTAITFVNQASAGVMTIAITTDTMRLAGAGTTGSRTLAANGIATAIKLTSTEWLISGTGLT